MPELTLEEREQGVLESIGEIFKVFDGMTQEYVKLIREHHKIATEGFVSPLPGRKIAIGKYSEEYIREHRAKTKIAVKELKKAYIDKAKEVIKSIKEKYGVKSPESPVVPSSPDEQMRYQLERNNNITLWKAQLETATIGELKNLYQEYQSNPDFIILFKAELRKREDNADLQRLILEIENPPEDKVFDHLKQIEIGVDNINQIDYFPVNLKHGFNAVSYRNVDSDLDKYPISEGIPGVPYRPVFDIKED